MLTGYGYVLALVSASICMQLLTTGSDGTRLLTVVLQAATLVAAVWTAGARRTLVRLAGAVAVVAVAISAVLMVVHGSVPPATAGIVNGLLVAVAPVALGGGLVRDLRTEHAVTLRTVAGVLAIYLLAGMFFSFLYSVIGAFDADAVFAGQVQSSGRGQPLLQLRHAGHGRVRRPHARVRPHANLRRRRDALRSDLPGDGGGPDREQPRPPPGAAHPSAGLAEKNSSAVRVLVCCSPERSTPRLARNARDSTATWNISAGAHLPDSSRIRAPSG